MTEASPTPSAFTDWTGFHGLPDFAAISDEDFRSAFDAALRAHLDEIETIAENSAPADFDNTIAAMELAGRDLSRVAALFFCRAGADTNSTIQAIERDIAPKLSRHRSAIAANSALFARVDALYRSRGTLDLSMEQGRVLERHWKDFVRAGAALDAEKQERLAAINEELASLGTRYGQNVLGDESAWALFLEEGGDLAGLPDFLRDAMAGAAEERGRPGTFAVTLSRSIIEPFLTFSENKELRAKAHLAWTMRGENGNENDNRANVSRILALRAEKAGLLGYASFADFKLDDTMAKTPEAVMELLTTVWTKATAKARDEEQALSQIAAGEGANEPIAAADWRHYSEKLRAQRYAFSESELKPYLQLEKIIAAAFDVAGRLFGLSFQERPDLKGYHPDVRVFAVSDGNGEPVGLFLADYFARASKRSGAWMSALRSQHKLNGGERPIIYNVMNFAKPRKGDPALLSLDDAHTLFHEFGHALHGLLSDVTYPSVSGTAVSRDFVELPSQLFEHWLMVPEILKTYAVHYRTGEPMPDALLAKVRAAETFNSGFDAVEYTASAIVDMRFHTEKPVDDPIAFEHDTLSRLGKPEAIAMRHRTPHFLHVFAGDGYSAGYYSYMWAQVLDADAFAAFQETGDPFDAATAQKLKRHVYSAGGSVDPEETYRAFRGRLPSPQAMLVQRGLAD